MTAMLSDSIKWDTAWQRQSDHDGCFLRTREASCSRQRRKRTLWMHVVLPGVVFVCALCARAQTATFDFDTGTPALTAGQSIPLDQISRGVTAHFSSPSGPAFSVQSDATTHWNLSQFSGNYLNANNLNRNVLSINFSQQLTAISLIFATADFQQVKCPQQSS